MNNLKEILQFGEINGQIKHINEVSSGLSCGLFCSKCGDKLVAKKGKKQINHFAHYKVENCKGAVETVLHKVSKEIIESKGYIVLPEISVKIGEQYKRYIFHRESRIEFDSIKLETKQGSIIPDIVIQKKNRKLYIEIAVTHFIDTNKKNILVEDKISTLEIDLSKCLRGINRQQLEDILLDSTTFKKWIYNARLEYIKSEIRNVQESMTAEYHFEDDYSRNRWHTKCPISRTGYATYNDKCSKCFHNVKINTDHYFGGKMSVICSGNNNANIWKKIQELGGSYH